MTNLAVGDALYYVDRRYEPSTLRQITILKVGRIYYEISLRGVKVRKDDLRSDDYRFYRSPEEWEEEKYRDKLIGKVKTFVLQYGDPYKDISTENLKQITKLLHLSDD